MKKVLAIVAVLMFAAPVMANDVLLAQLGLSGLQVVSVDEATQVSGRGFISTNGMVEAEIDFADTLGSPLGFFTDIDANQSIDVEGLNNLASILGAAGSIEVDYSEDTDGLYFVYGGKVTVVTGATASGNVDQ